MAAMHAAHARWHPREWLAWLGIGLGWCLSRAPWAIQRRIGALLGGMLGTLARRRRRTIARNLALCFPDLDDRARDDLLRNNLRDTGIGLFEFLRAWWGRPLPDGAAECVGLEHLREARAGGHGVLLVSAHFLHIEMAARLLAREVPFAALYRPHDSAAMEWAVARSRTRYTVATFPRGELRPVVRFLKAGGVLWFAPDQESRRGESVFVPFFGRPAWTLTSTHQLARLGQAVVLPFLHERLPDGRYRLEIKPPLAGFPSMDPIADTARVMATLEEGIRRAPSQYLWLHQRFKTQPGLDRGALYR